jgi:hypothetical protein
MLEDDRNAVRLWTRMLASDELKFTSYHLNFLLSELDKDVDNDCEQLLLNEIYKEIDSIDKEIKIPENIVLDSSFELAKNGMTAEAYEVIQRSRKSVNTILSDYLYILVQCLSSENYKLSAELFGRIAGSGKSKSICKCLSINHHLYKGLHLDSQLIKGFNDVFIPVIKEYPEESLSFLHSLSEIDIISDESLGNILLKLWTDLDDEHKRTFSIILAGIFKSQCLPHEVINILIDDLESSVPDFSSLENIRSIIEALKYHNNTDSIGKMITQLADTLPNEEFYEEDELPVISLVKIALTAFESGLNDHGMVLFELSLDWELKVKCYTDEIIEILIDKRVKTPGLWELFYKKLKYNLNYTDAIKLIKGIFKDAIPQFMEDDLTLFSNWDDRSFLNDFISEGLIPLHLYRNEQKQAIKALQRLNESGYDYSVVLNESKMLIAFYCFSNKDTETGLSILKEINIQNDLYLDTEIINTWDKSKMVTGAEYLLSEIQNIKDPELRKNLYKMLNGLLSEIDNLPFKLVNQFILVSSSFPEENFYNSIREYLVETQWDIHQIFPALETYIDSRKCIRVQEESRFIYIACLLSSGQIEKALEQLILIKSQDIWMDASSLIFTEESLKWIKPELQREIVYKSASDTYFDGGFFFTRILPALINKEKNAKHDCRQLLKELGLDSDWSLKEALEELTSGDREKIQPAISLYQKSGISISEERYNQIMKDFLCI